MPIRFYRGGTALLIAQVSATSRTQLTEPEKAQGNAPEVSDD